MRDRPVFELFVISWLVLFLELACIRWFPAHVLFLTFFVNLVLLACFVGMSVGCLVARRTINFICHTPYWLLLGIILGLVTDRYSHWLRVVFAVGDPAKPDVVYFGTENVSHAAHLVPFTVPMELVGGLFFTIIAGIMVGPGQEMGRAFNRVSNRTSAYSANLLGSLLGIGMFAACSYLRLPPLMWFSLAGVVAAFVMLRAGKRDAASKLIPLCCLFAAVLLTARTSGYVGADKQSITWSQYYRVDYEYKNQFINTNLISHQLIEPADNLASSYVPYALPYLFQRDLKKPDGTTVWPKFQRVLIIGAGNGNDVSRALMFLKDDPSLQIDAVEIEPVIQQLGALHHPDEPFKDNRVKVHINDGRNFLREAKDGTYDLVVFALIDSLVLQSGYSNLRLESYLFTLESFKDVRRVLKPTGAFAMYNFFRQPWLVARIREQLRACFEGVDPIVITTPPIHTIRLSDSLTTLSTGFFAGSAETVEPLRKAFVPQDGQAVKYWYPWFAGASKDVPAHFGIHPPSLPNERWTGDKPPKWLGLVPAEVEDSKGSLRPADDNWPYLYTREPQIPNLTWRSIALTLILSIGLWFAFGGKKALAAEAGTKPDYPAMLRAFFLGAGFMLVETKAVVQMALLFGGTWMVNTAVFAAILVMSLFGNLYAGKVNPKRLEPYYIGLFVTLAIGLAVTPSAFLGMGATAQVIGACAVVFAPIAFAGVIFATSFKRTAQPDRVFGANVAGALVGGLAENASVVLGFQLLLCVAVGFYLLSATFGNRAMADSAAK